MTTFERRVRAAVFRHFADHGVAPSSADLVRVVSLSSRDVHSTLRALATAHLLVLEESGRIQMAGPFAGAPTPFRVASGDRSWWGNCAWDALAIPPLVGENATLSTRCPDCDETIDLAVVPADFLRPGGPRKRHARAEVSPQGKNGLVVHYVVPASRWWDDIRYT